MTEPVDSGIPGLDELATRYRRQTAPPGFAARVMAGAERRPPRAWNGAPRWAMATAVLVLAVVIGLPLLRDRTLPPTAVRAAPETLALASASAWLARNEPGTPAPIIEIPSVMSVQSIADIPDPLS